jgi:diguanylate cyclase (GGDEF)-like protein/PAS domain S-box-containing protein
VIRFIPLKTEFSTILFFAELWVTDSQKVVIPAKAGIQDTWKILERLDSHFRGYDTKKPKGTFYEIIVGDAMKDDEKTREQLVYELTELSSQNAALKKSESPDKYRSLVENLRDVIYELDSQGVVLYISPAVRDMLGYDSSEIVGKNFIELAYKDDQISRAEWFSELRKGIESPSEYRVSNKSGEYKWAQTRVRPIIEDGQFKGARGILLDVTEQRRTEEALRESEEKYRLTFENVADVIYVIDANLNILSVSPSVERILGYKPQDFIGRPVSDLTRIFTPESFEQAIADTSLILKGETIAATIYRFIAKDGTIKYGEVNSSPVMRDDQIVGIISVARDISDRKRAEEKLRESEEKYRWVMNNMADVITVMDMNLHFTYVSPSVIRMRGYTAEEAVAQTFEQIMTPKSLQISARVFEEEMKLEAGGTADPDRIRIVEVEQYRKDGSIVMMENHLSFMRDEAKKAVGIISVSSDVTVRKQAEEALRENENKYRLLADNVADVIFVLDMNLNYTYVSPSVKILRGYDPEEVLKQQPSEILAPSSLDLAMKTLSEIMELEKSKPSDMPISETLELEMIRKDGGAVWTEVKFSFIRDENQHPMGILGLTRDITERKQAEDALRESEERFRRIFDEGPVGLGIESPDRTIIAANKVLCELLGYTEQELVGQSATDITYEEDREKSKELLGQLFADGAPVVRLEKRYIRKDGTILWANTSISAIHGQDGNILYGLAIIEDLTEGRKAAEKIRLLAYYDSLTGLPNRTFYKELLNKVIGHARRRKEIFALIYIGLDNFKRINDTLGYGIGDLLLKTVADRLANALRKSDYVARSDEHEIENIVSRAGGDEFIILAHDTKQSHNAAQTSRRLLEELSAPYDLNGKEVFITVSIGIALYPDDGTDADDLLKNAEKSMRHTKNEGKNNFHFYSSSMHASVLELLTLENDLHRALERNELMLYYQPKVDAATRRVTGMEALIRWSHPDKGLVSPMQFIPMAETSGLILPIGEFVIRTVCKQIKTWQEAGYQQVNIALNVSGRQFDQQNLMEIVQEALQDARVPPQYLELEITESTIMRNPEKAIRILAELKALGLLIAIDDFGTGFSSLSYLKRLPLDFLKIDQSFVNGLASDPKDQAIIRTIIAMAHSLNLKTIAEGVETEAQLSFLQEHGCDEIQGYLFSRPLPAEEIPGILAKEYL